MSGRRKELDQEAAALRSSRLELSEATTAFQRETRLARESLSREQAEAEARADKAAGIAAKEAAEAAAKEATAAAAVTSREELDKERARLAAEVAAELAAERDVRRLEEIDRRNPSIVCVIYKRRALSNALPPRKPREGRQTPLLFFRVAFCNPILF